MLLNETILRCFGVVCGLAVIVSCVPAGLCVLPRLSKEYPIRSMTVIKDLLLMMVPMSLVSCGYVIAYLALSYST